MTTISVPMPTELIKFIDNMISVGDVENRAQAIRKAVRKLQEQWEIDEILQASKDIDNGLFYTGDLKEILKKKKHA